MTDNKDIGTVNIHLNIRSSADLDRLFAALKEVEAATLAPEAISLPTPELEATPEPEKVLTAGGIGLTTAPVKTKASKAKANGPVTTQAVDTTPPEQEPLSRDEVRALLGLFASKYGMAAAVALVKGQGVDHLDALPVEKLPELAAQLNLPPSDKAS